MVNPVTALIVFSALLILLFLLFMPGYGLVHFWKRIKSDKKKILIEDSLKFIYDLMLRKKGCTRKSLIEGLGLSGQKTDDLIQMLLKLNLIIQDDAGLRFTAEGNEYAVKVVRIHRLLEKFLAEETSIKEDYWHILAEDKEHNISDEEAESLSAKLGNPLTDPHGDPIPDVTGEQLHTETKPLDEMKQGEAGIISHIEDEPPEIYSKILALKLQLGTRLRIITIDERGIFINAAGSKILVPQNLAANIFTSEPVEEFDEEGLKRLSELKMNEEGVIAGISKAMRGQQRRRLLDFGFVPGTAITVRLSSIGNDPVAYDIRSTTVALRRQQADLVYIKQLNSGGEHGSN